MLRKIVKGMAALLLCAALATAGLPASAWGENTVSSSSSVGTALYIRTGNAGKLHLRQSPSKKSASLGLFANGTPVTMLAQYNEWAYVNVSGRTGYMMLQFLASTGPSQTAAPLPTFAPTESTLMYIRTGNAGKLHLRAAPQKNAASLGLFANGTQVIVLARSGGWANVQVEGRTGYMMLQFLTLTVPAATPQPTATPGEPSVGGETRYVKTGNTGKLHLRAAPQKNAASLGLFANGTQVTVLAQSGSWYYVSVQGQTGYMMRRFLSADGSGALQPTPRPGASGGTMYVRTGSSAELPLFAQANTGSDVLARYANDTVVSVLSTSGEWVRVSVQGKTGYMQIYGLTSQRPASPIVPELPAPTAAPTAAPGTTAAPAVNPGQATVQQKNGSYVNLRAYRNSEVDNVIAQVPSGTVVDVLEWGKVWSKVQYGAQVGYMVSSYLH